MSANTQQTLQKGIVKQVLSGDTIIVRGQPKGGPPPERTIGLTSITAPRLSRRPTPTQEDSIRDEPYAWEAREFLRKKLIGKAVSFYIEAKPPTGTKEYGIVFAGNDASAENVAESLVAEGLVEVRKTTGKPPDEKLIQLEDLAKSQGIGKWGPPEILSEHVRNVIWTVENPRHFVDSLHQKPIDAVVEHVRDCCTVRAFLLPSFTYVTVMLSGIKGPMFRIEGDETIAEEFAVEGKFFTESRLLQRDVQIVLEGVSNQNLIGSIQHPNGNITEYLLREGFARCVDWSITLVTQGPEKLREAEKFAKDRRVRIWKTYVPSKVKEDIKDKSYTATVTEIINGDGLVVKLADGSSRKIFLSSVRPPRPSTDPAATTEGGPRKAAAARPRALYDVPYMFEAREFLRKKLVGKKVQVTVDYIQPSNNDLPERSCCTVSISNSNVAEALVSKGLATVVRYRADDDRRSSAYDTLLAAEARAEKKGVGVHSKKAPPVIRVADVSGDATKAKQFLPFLQRAGRSTALVEFVASGSRVRLYIPKETCLVTFLLSGIECPRDARPEPGNPKNMLQAEHCGAEAAAFTRDSVMQKEVEIEVENMDKGGNFIGWMFIDNVNISLALVEKGLAKVHFTAERSSYYSAMLDAENRARDQHLGLWKNYVPPAPLEEEENKEESAGDMITERNVQYKSVVITEIGTTPLHFYAQDYETGPMLEKLMDELRIDMEASPPLPGAYVPKRGDLCSAKFTDGEWYRAKVEKVEGNAIHLFYIDFGNREKSDGVRLAILPSKYQAMAAQAKEYQLAFVQLPPDEEDRQMSLTVFKNEILNNQFLLNIEYKKDGFDCVTLFTITDKEDVGKDLVSEGWLIVEKRRERRLQSLVSDYTKAQDKAKSARRNLWQYGDFTEDDATEFGLGKQR